MKSWEFWAKDNTDLTNATPEMALILAAGLGSRLRPRWSKDCLAHTGAGHFRAWLVRRMALTISLKPRCIRA